MDNYLYIYGGSYATSTVNDLWRLDLNTNIWEGIRYRDILGAPLTKKLVPRNYRVVGRRKICYYDERIQQLFVIHLGGLSNKQRDFVTFDDSLSEFESRMNDEENKDDIDKDEYGDDNGCYVFMYDIKERMWMIMNKGNDKRAPKEAIGSARYLRIGEFMVLMGGGSKYSEINYMKELHLMKLPNYRVFNFMSWTL